MIMMREMRRKRKDITKETEPFTMGSRLLPYSGERNIKTIVSGTQTYVNLSHERKISSLTKAIITEIINKSEEKMNNGLPTECASDPKMQYLSLTVQKPMI